jgi:WD40 repeat protein
MLSVSSDTDTVHVYKLEKPNPIPETTTARRGNGYLDSLYLTPNFSTSPLVSAAGTVGSFLPTNITDIWEPQRHFAFAKIPTTSVKDRINICAFNPGDRPTLCVLTSDGSFYLYSITDEGGECVLLRTDSVMDEEE